MYDITKPKRSIFFKVFAVVISVLLITILVFLVSFKSLGTFFVNRSQDVNLSYGSWGRNLFDISNIDALVLELNRMGLVVKADQVYLDKSFCLID